MTFTLAAQDLNKTINLNNVSVNVFLTALENVAALRAQNGSTMSRLEFQETEPFPPTQQYGGRAPVGLLMWIWERRVPEWRSIMYLRQSSAAMLAQANQSPEVVFDATQINTCNHIIHMFHNLERMLGDA